MIYTFARVGAVLQMNVGDYFTQGRRGWVRLHEKGGKEHEAPCHHKLEVYLDEYMAAAGIAADKDGPLFRTTGRSTGTPHRMTQPDAYRMIERRAQAGGHQNQNRQSLPARHRHHRLPEKRRLAGRSPQDGEPCRHPHHAALRPARGCRLARRIQQGGDLSDLSERAWEEYRSSALYQRVMKHLPPIISLDLLILKGHLLIEEQMDALIAARGRDARTSEGSTTRVLSEDMSCQALYGSFLGSLSGSLWKDTYPAVE